MYQRQVHNCFIEAAYESVWKCPKAITEVIFAKYLTGDEESKTAESAEFKRMKPQAFPFFLMRHVLIVP